ncbi:P-type conjugative transfer protein TrbG [Nostoc sp. 3335mG]|nr:P-type conjugative transfer protein TrbG [Nostoc sp. 3335mG]
MTRPIAFILLAGTTLALEGAAPPAPPISADRSVPASVSTSSHASARPHRTARRYVRRAPSPTDTRIRTANSAAIQEPVAQGFLNAVQVYPFADGAIFHAYTSPGRVTDIALQPGETLGSVASGDTVRWVIGDTSSGSGDAKRTHVLVKPFTAGLATNLVITTDKRIYYVALTSTAGSAMAALSWTYPADQLIALQKAAEKAEAAVPVATGLDVTQLHFGYTISGDQATWRPLRAFDDGRQTFIEFPADIATGEAPPLFLIDDKGAAQLVNYRVKGRFYVVDRLFDTAELRIGLKHQAVVRISRTGDAAPGRRAS